MDTRTIPTDTILTEAANELREYMKEVGGCDHNVGICVCHIDVLISKLDRRAKELRARREYSIKRRRASA